jgi:predicted nucleic acid-binding Zn ribbon protein
VRYVIQEHYDDQRQVCTNTGDCDWKGTVHDEPWNNCPRCSCRLKEVGPGA